jgi:hypothetical protein
MSLIITWTDLARSWILENGLPAMVDYIFGKSQKSQGARSGEYGRFSIKWIPF